MAILTDQSSNNLVDEGGGPLTDELDGGGHGFAAGVPVVFSTDGALPAGLTAGTVYYVIAVG